MGTREKANRRRWLRIALVGGLGSLAIVVLALATVPFWLGLALGWLLPDEQVSFSRYERVGYSRFRLADVAVSSGESTVNVSRVEAYSPLVWLWHSLREDRALPYVVIEEARVDARPSGEDADASAGSISDLVSALRLVDESVATADKWLPTAEVDSLVVAFGEQVLHLENAIWKNREFSVSAESDRYPNRTIELGVALKGGGADIRMSVPELSASIDLAFVASAATVAMKSDFRLAENALSFIAEFDESGWLPVSANWSAESWEVDTRDYDVDFLYSDIRFDLSGEWVDGNYSMNLAGVGAVSSDDESIVPEVAVESQVNGDLNGVLIESLSLSAPGVAARMRESFGIDYAEREIAGNARLDLDFDLGLLNLDNLKGALSGVVEISSNAQGRPYLILDLKGDSVVFEEYRLDDLALDVSLDGAILEVHSSRAILHGDSVVTVEGVSNLTDRRISSALVAFELRDAFLETVVPSGHTVSNVDGTLEIEGAWSSLSHKGEVSVGRYEHSLLKTLTGALSWKGMGDSRIELTASMDSEEIGLSLIGSIEKDGDRVSGLLDSFALSKESGSLELTSPSGFEFELGESLGATLERFALQGNGTELIVDGALESAELGSVSASIRQLDTREWVDPWLIDSVPVVLVRNAEFRAEWNDEPLRFDGVWDVSHEHEPEVWIDASGAFGSDGNSMLFEAFSLSDEDGVWVTASGSAPYAVSLSEGAGLVSTGGELALSLESGENPALTKYLSGVIDFPIEQFAARVELSGRLASPVGLLEFSMATTESGGMTQAKAVASAAIDGTEIAIEKFETTALDQTFSVSGKLMLPQEALDLIELKEATVPWRETFVELSIPHSSLSPLAYFLPEAIAPGGDVSADLSGRFAKGLTGSVRINGLNTRPIFPFGSFREMRADLEFVGRRAELKGFSGQIGREPVEMSGFVDFRKFGSPEFEFTLKGAELPILKQPGLLLRTDLDLVIAQAEDGNATISGRVTPKDGLFLMDTSVLVSGSSGGGRSVETRPPYFSVEAAPFADWTLDVRIEGESFMNLQTPAANGDLSIAMSLLGTLEEPFMNGFVRFEKGDLLFPFAAFSIERGSVELKVDDPYTPRLEIAGTSRRLGYDLGVEITGDGFDPQVRFFSSPPLSSEQILMMVMAGENPDGAFDYSASQKASKLGMYLSKGLFGSGGSGGGIGSRLSLSSGENLSRQGKETMEIEFLLDNRLQLISEYDAYDAWNVGLRWRLLQRKAKERPKDSALEAEDSE